MDMGQTLYGPAMTVTFFSLNARLHFAGYVQFFLNNIYHVPIGKYPITLKYETLTLTYKI